MDLMIDVSPQSPWNVDIGWFAQATTRLIQENVVDAGLRDWIIPNFSTTTDTDKSVAGVVMMGTLKSYFTYELRGGCGFPSVTLMGERSDWEQILHKVQTLPKYGKVTEEWGRRLTRIIKLMIESFDSPNSQRVKYFWLRACHSTIGGSGEIGTISGWLMAFCFWSDDGSRTEEFSDEDLSKLPTPIVIPNRLILDGVAYPIIASGSIPQGVVSVPVTVQDDQTRLQHKTQLFGGCVGMTATTVGSGKSLQKMQPRSGWWMLETSVQPM